MKWINLKNNICPQCNKDFMKGLVVESNMRPTLFTHKCGFKITEKRYQEIVSEMVIKNIHDQNYEPMS